MSVQTRTYIDVCLQAGGSLWAKAKVSGCVTPRCELRYLAKKA
jgi:hypothetical protein